MAHNIQPPASAAPTMMVESTDEAPHGAAISEGIAVPGPPPGEMETHTGAQNSLDPYVYKQDVHHATIPWSTSDQPGKLIHQIEITPLIHPILAVYALLYNCWSGGLTFVFKFCGTAFHAGFMGIARIPPNMNPIDWAPAKKFTGFEWIGIDPKMQEIGTITVRDQRQVEYHYTVPEDGTPNSWSRAGYLAFYVMDQLATSSTGVNQIQIEIFVKAAPDFRFSQIMLPRPSRADLIFQFPKTLLDAVTFSSFASKDVMLASSPTPVDIMEVLPSSIKSLNQYRYNCFHFDGTEATARQQGGFRNMATIYEATITYPSLDGATLEFKDGCWDVARQDGIIIFKDSKDKYYSSKISSWSSDPLSIVLKNVEGIIPCGEPEAPSAGKCSYVYYDSGDDTNFIQEPNYLGPFTNKESIIVFRGSYSSKLRCIETAAIAALLSTGDYARLMAPNLCALFQLVKTSDQLPLAYVKWYDSGLMTTSATEVAIEYVLDEIHLEFVSFLPRTDPPPSNPTMASNRMLYAIVSASARKLSLM